MLTKLDLVIDTVGSYHDLLWYGIYHDVHWCFMMAPVLWQFFYTCHLQIVKPLGHYRCLVFWHFLTIGLRTRRFSEPTVWLPRAARKSRVFREFVTFSLPRIFFFLLLSLVWPSFFWPFLWLFAVTWLHLWASRSKLPSNISSIALSATYVLDESCILTCCPSDSVLLLGYIQTDTACLTQRSPDKVFTLGFLGHFSHSQLRAQPLKLFEVGEARGDGLGHSACTWPQISLQSFRAKPKPGWGLERRYRKLNTLK